MSSNLLYFTQFSFQVTLSGKLTVSMMLLYRLLGKNKMLKIYQSKSKLTKVCCPWVKGYKMNLISYCLRYVWGQKLFRDGILEALGNGKGTGYSTSNQSFILTQKKISPKPIGYIFKQLMEQTTLFL